VRGAFRSGFQDQGPPVDRRDRAPVFLGNGEAGPGGEGLGHLGKVRMGARNDPPDAATTARADGNFQHDRPLPHALAKLAGWIGRRRAIDQARTGIQFARRVGRPHRLAGCAFHRRRTARRRGPQGRFRGCRHRGRRRIDLQFEIGGLHGEIHPAILEEMDIKFPVVGFEVMLGNIPEAKKKGTEKAMLNLEPLQPLSRDFAFLVDEDVLAGDLVRAAKAADKALITDAAIFDIYQGKGVEDGKKSVALSVSIQPKEQSLNDKDLEALMQKVVDIVADKCGGVLRG